MDIEYQDALARLLSEGDRAYHNLDLDAAVDSYQHAADLEPASYEAQLGLARTYSRMRARPQALAACEQCIALNPDRYEAYAAKATLLFLSDDLDEAEASARAALERADQEPEPWLTLAQIAGDRAHFEEADHYLAEARERIAVVPPGQERDELTAMAWHAETYLRLMANDPTAARETAQKVIEMEEASPYAAALAYSNLGILETRARHYDQAIEYLERAYATNPHFYRAAAALGRVLIIRGQYQRAAEVLSEAVGRDESDRGETRYAHAVALARSGRPEEARAQYQQALNEGLGGVTRLLARWQTLWLRQPVRVALIAACALLLLVWAIAGQPSQQVLTLVALVVVILVLQRILARRS